MPQLSTGFVIAGAYADKLRRVLFAQLRDEIKKGNIENRQVAYRAGELNRLLFEILVNKLKLDKGDVVRIRIEYDVKDGDIVWKLDTLRVEAFRRIPDEEVEKAVREVVGVAKEVLARPVTEEERAWTEAKEREVEREVARRREEAVAAAAAEKPAEVAAVKPPVEPFSATLYGETSEGEKLALLKDEDENNIGLMLLKPENGATKVTAILVAGKEAYKAEGTLEKPVEDIDEAEIVKIAKELKYSKIDKTEAMEFIRKKMEEIL
jgi:hypothetical protein